MPRTDRYKKNSNKQSGSQPYTKRKDVVTKSTGTKEERGVGGEQVLKVDVVEKHASPISLQKNARTERIMRKLGEVRGISVTNKCYERTTSICFLIDLHLFFSISKPPRPTQPSTNIPSTSNKPNPTNRRFHHLFLITTAIRAATSTPTRRAILR